MCNLRLLYFQTLTLNPDIIGCSHNHQLILVQRLQKLFNKTLNTLFMLTASWYLTLLETMERYYHTHCLGNDAWEKS